MNGMSTSPLGPLANRATHMCDGGDLVAVAPQFQQVAQAANHIRLKSRITITTICNNNNSHSAIPCESYISYSLLMST